MHHQEWSTKYMSLSNHEAKEEELHFKSIDNALSNYGC